MDIKKDLTDEQKKYFASVPKELCELDYFRIEELYGGNQELFSNGWMRIGGCAAVTACDMCIYLDMYKAMSGLYPHDIKALTKHSYEQFAMEMCPYLRPRYSGIDKLDIYIDGFGSYLADRGFDNIQLSGFDGHESYSAARAFVISHIRDGYPVPYLNLRHMDSAFSDFVWHWFLLTGYAVFDDVLMVKAVSYGEYVWLDFAGLWNTGYSRKGGMISVSVM